MENFDMSPSVSSIGSPASTSSDQPSHSVTQRRKSRVSAEHTLNRVRENQRRHRARQKDHVATLEQKLAETELLLLEARAEIAKLKEEQAAANAMCQLQLHPSSSTETDIDIMGVDPPSTEQLELSTNSSPVDVQLDYINPDLPDLAFLGNPSSPTFIGIFTNSQIPLALEPSGPKPISGPPPCCSDPPSSSPADEPADPECSTCKTRPPPDPSESTTLCAQAYVMISQHNFRNLDPATIRMWLAQGLRRAQREGEGCRVENGALMRLLDYMSGI